MSKKSKVNEIYHKDVRSSKEFVASTQKTLQLSRNDKKNMTIKEIITIVKGLEEVAKQDGLGTQMLVKGLGPSGEFTLKGWNEPLKTIDEYIDYFNNNVKVPIKFDSFYNIQVSIFSAKLDKKGNFVHREDTAHEKVQAMVPGKKVAEKKVTVNIFKDKKSKK